MIRLDAFVNERRIVDLSSGRKADALKELLRAADLKGCLSDADAFLSAVLSREKAMSTGIGDGIAIPHARIQAVQEPFLAIGRSAKGIDYGAADRRPVHLVALIGVGPDQSRLYLQLLSKTLSRLVDDGVRGLLLEAPDAGKVLEILTSTD